MRVLDFVDGYESSQEPSLVGLSAGDVSTTPSGNLAATDVQTALNELQADVDTRATSATVTAHTSAAAGAHAATAISSTPSGNLAATTVQAALNELQTDVDTRATSTALTTHTSNATGAHAASAISVSPSGNLSSTTVQAALSELQTDIDSVVGGTSLPAGMLAPFAGTSAPSGWLLCYGQEVAQATYPALYTALGATYGAATAGNFKLPDMRGRAAVGKDDMGGATASRITNAGAGIVGTTLGAAGGSETHTLTTTQMPVHTHTAKGSGSAEFLYIRGSGGAVASPGGGTAWDRTASNDIVNNNGSGNAHNNTQPSIILNYIIKT